MNWKDVVAEMLKPNDKLGSVIDTFLAIGNILEVRQKVVKGEYFEPKDYDKSVVDAMFTLGFFPFYIAHAGSIRPLFLQAIQSDNKNAIEDFFAEAIPCALTIAMPHTQLEYSDIRNKVRQKFKE